jgi:hypothetical protein
MRQSMYSKHTAQRTFYGLHLSYMGEFFGRRLPDAHQNTTENMRRARTRIERVSNLLQTFTLVVKEECFSNQEYYNTVVYCDSPYVGNHDAKWVRHTKCVWDENLFWKAIFKWTDPARNNMVFVSIDQPLPSQSTANNVNTEILWQRKNGINGHTARMEYLLLCSRR